MMHNTKKDPFGALKLIFLTKKSLIKNSDENCIEKSV